MTSTFYFAYGSNMLVARLQARIPSVRYIGRAQLLHKKLVCNKKSKDGSGKANLINSPGTITWGVLYAVDAADLETLDRYEAGYDREVMEVIPDEGNPVSAVVYIASAKRVRDGLLPLEEYKQLIVAGAEEHALPPEYIAFLQRLPVLPQNS